MSQYCFSDIESSEDEFEFTSYTEVNKIVEEVKFPFGLDETKSKHKRIDFLVHSNILIIHFYSHPCIVKISNRF